MIKKWNQFNESKAEKPGPNVPGSVKVNLSDEEVNYFSDESSLSKLIQDDKVALLGNEAWYWEGDEQTKAILDQYLEIAGKNELESVVESSINEEHHIDDIQGQKDYIISEISKDPDYLEGFLDTLDSDDIERLYRQVERWAGEY